MEENPNRMKYMSREEYEEEFEQTGGEDFLLFLSKEIDEAGDAELRKHIKNIYDMVANEIEEQWFQDDDYYEEYTRGYSSKDYKESLKGFAMEELKEKYKNALEEIEQYKKQIQRIEDQIESGDLVKSDIYKLEEDRGQKYRELDYIKAQARVLQNKIKIEELKSKISQMTSEEVIEEYVNQLSQKQGDMARRKYGLYYNPTDIDFINETIELIETHSTSHPELETLIAEQKEHKARIEQGQEEDLSSLSIEELLEIINRNNQAIDCNEQLIKQALTQKILGQQQKIAEQKNEINRLQGQKEQK